MNPPKPTALKVLDGTIDRNKHRLNRDEPKMAALTEVPEPPAFIPLGTIARAAWDDIAARAVALGVLTSADLPLLASVCRDWAEYEAASKSSRGWHQADAAKRRFDTGLRGFGLSPSDRTRVHAVAARKAEDRMAALAQPRRRSG